MEIMKGSVPKFFHTFIQATGWPSILSIRFSVSNRNLRELRMRTNKPHSKFFDS
ncbi:peptidase S9 [Sesbania bispinosa]|nr:peptidase S9 [Sesbania bispinosa]